MDKDNKIIQRREYLNVAANRVELLKLNSRFLLLKRIKAYKQIYNQYLTTISG